MDASTTDRLRRARDGLVAAATRLTEGEGDAGASVRRLGRMLAGDEGAGIELTTAGSELGAVEEGALAAAAALVAGTLDALVGEADGPELLLVKGGAAAARELAAPLLGAGYRVRWLPRGEAVPEALAQRPAEVVVLDLLLPDQDGRDVVVALSEAPGTAELPVIVLGPGGDAFALARAESLALGARGVLPRPLDPDVLVAELGRHTGGSPAGSGDEDEQRGALLRRGPFASCFDARERSGGAVALLAFDDFRGVADRHGADATFGAVGALGKLLRREARGLSAICRWGLPQLALFFEESAPAEARASIAATLEGVEAGGSDDPVLGELLRRISGGIVPVRDDLALDRITLAAGRVRLGEPGPEGSVRLSTAPDAPAGAEGGAGADPSPPVILTVEDDPVASALVQHKLRHVGFEILHFDNGDEALAALPHTDFDLAIFDLNLPGADGFQLVKAVRAHERKHGGRRPIIILSGMTGEEAIVRGLELGADDYILKPFSPVELTARVRRLLPSDRSRR